MDSIFLWCAIAGGSLLALQILVSLVGGEIDADADFDAGDGDAFVQVLSIKTLVGAAAFFGLGGLAARQFGVAPTWSLAIASTAGLAAIYTIAWLMNALHRLQADGTVDLSNAAGSEGRCYLRIPADGTGRGRVTLTIQGRSLECHAITRGPAIPTGTPVRVTALRSPDTLEVTRLES
ncbi:MAG: hypothetical protein KDB80_03830 [Planctomycetes bacterium]|nr:hypothetical protein [Planctomycetota bacterium]